MHVFNINDRRTTPSYLRRFWHFAVRSRHMWALATVAVLSAGCAADTYIGSDDSALSATAETTDGQQSSSDELKDAVLSGGDSIATAPAEKASTSRLRGLSASNIKARPKDKPKPAAPKPTDDQTEAAIPDDGGDGSGDGSDRSSRAQRRAPSPPSPDKVNLEARVVEDSKKQKSSGSDVVRRGDDARGSANTRRDDARKSDTRAASTISDSALEAAILGDSGSGSRAPRGAQSRPSSDEVDPGARVADDTKKKKRSGRGKDAVGDQDDTQNGDARKSVTRAAPVISDDALNAAVLGVGGSGSGSRIPLSARSLPSPGKVDLGARVVEDFERRQQFGFGGGGGVAGSGDGTLNSGNTLEGDARGYLTRPDTPPTLENGVYTLHQAWRDALQQDPAVAAALNDIAAAAHGAQGSLRQFDLNITGLANGGLNFDSGSSTTGFVGPWGTFGFTLTQPVFTFGRVDAAIGVAVSQVRVEQARRGSVAASTLERTGEAYISVLEQRALRRIIRDDLANSERQLGAMQEQFAVGKVPITDVRRLQSRVKQLSARLINAELQLDLAHENLSVETGVSTRGQVTEAPLLDMFRRVSLDENSVVNGHLQRAPTIIEATANAAVAQFDAQLARAQRFPQVNFVVSARNTYGRTRDIFGNLGDYQQNDRRVTFEMSGNIFDSGRVAADTARIEEQQRAAQQRLVSANRSAEFSARTRVQTAVSAARVLNQWDQSLALEREAVRDLRGAYETGGIQLDILLAAEESTLQTALSREQFRFDRLRAIMQVATLTDNVADGVLAKLDRANVDILREFADKVNSLR